MGVGSIPLQGNFPSQDRNWVSPALQADILMSEPPRGLLKELGRMVTGWNRCCAELHETLLRCYIRQGPGREKETMPVIGIGRI